MTERKFPNISRLGIVWKEPEDIQTTHDEENKIPKIVKIPIDIFFRERPPPRLHVSFPPAGTSLKFNISPAGTPARPGRHPPPLWTSPFSRWRRCLVTMAILLLDRWLQPPPTTLPQYPPSPPDSFVLPATGTTNQSRTAKKYSITRQELEGGGGGGGCCVGGGK